MYLQSPPGTQIFGFAGFLRSAAVSIVFLASVIVYAAAEDIFPRAMVSPPGLTVPSNLGTHDPSRLIYDDGGYYFYSTSDGISGWYTTDNGDTWKETGEIFPNGIPAEVHAACPTNDGHSIWAPDVIWNPNDNLFYIYYAVADWNNDTRSVIGLVTSPTLNPSKAVWTDRGIVIAKTPSANTYNAIDPGPFFDLEGNMWLTLGSGYGSTRSTALNVIALDKNTGLRSDNSVHVLESCGCEASYIQPHDGYYYLFWNTGGCCSGASSTYTIHVARSTSVTGPYSGTETFLASSTHVHGPGQIGFITLDGTDYYTYHYYPDSGGSVLGIGAIAWNNGWPDANGSAGDGGGSSSGSSSGSGGSGTTSISNGKTTTTSITKTTSTSKTTSAAGSTGTVAHYGQCGGQGWTGPTVCVAGTTCTYSSVYYSQCL